MAKNTPAFQFYPSDFICGTMLLSPEATGAYIRILCVLWMESNLLSVCFRKLQTITQTDAETFARIWPEIEGKFVISDGTLSHARFAQMMEISEKRRQSGSLGGRPVKQIDNQNESKTESKSEANSRRMKNEDRSMKNTYSSDFIAFWSAFPSGRKQSKGLAYRAWKEAVKAEDAETIIQAAKDYAKSDVGRGEFVKGPAPWLNGRCWEDDRAAWTDKSKPAEPQVSTYRKV
jgi:uncharacterized protein YdaU (DUF1376 family)